MKLLAEITNPRAAQGFCDYLKTQKIDVQLVAGEAQSVAIFVAEADFSLAQTLWHEFVKNPEQEKYLSASWYVGNNDSGLSYAGKPLNITKQFISLDWLIQSVTIIAVVLYIAFILGGFEFLFNMLQFQPDNPINWLTPALIHFSAAHIIFNLMWWMHLGNKITKNLGKMTLILLFLISAVISNWSQYLVTGPSFGGLSGVVYALLGFCWIYGYLKPQSAIDLPKPIVGFMLGWMLLGFADVLFINMANWAHLAGLLSGTCYAFLLVKLKK